jgi:TolA-binding protein
MRCAWILVTAWSCSSSGGSAVVVSDTRHAPADAPPTDSQDPQDAPAAAPFPLDQRVPYFATGDAAEALTRYRRQEFSLAAEAAERALARTEDSAERHRLRILLAVNLRELGSWSRAASLFVEAAAGDTVIPDFLHFQAARALARAGEPGADKEASLVRAASPWASDTAFLLAESARAAAQHEEAIQGYAEYLQGGANAELVEEARFRLGESLVAIGQKERALRSWRRLAVSAPVSPWADRARGAEPTVETDLTGSELMERGMAYFDAMRNGSSEADFALALKLRR